MGKEENRMKSHYPVVSIMFPNWNGIKDTIDCLTSLSALDYPKEQLEIIIVDNASIDGSPNAIKKMFVNMQSEGWKGLHLIELKENIGIPGAYNVAYASISSEAVAVLRIENDVVLAPNSLGYLVRTLFEKEEIGVVGAQIRDYTTQQVVWGAIFFDTWSGRFRRTFPVSAVACSGVLGCTMLIRKTAITAMPFFFDESLKICSDETDLSYRLSRMGYTTWYSPDAVVLHKGGKSTGKVPKLTFYYSTRNGILLTRRYAPWPHRWIRYLVTVCWVSKQLLKGNLLGVRAVLDGFTLPKNPHNWSDAQKDWFSL